MRLELQNPVDYYKKILEHRTHSAYDVVWSERDDRKRKLTVCSSVPMRSSTFLTMGTNSSSKLF